MLMILFIVGVLLCSKPVLLNSFGAVGHITHLHFMQARQFCT